MKTWARIILVGTVFFLLGVPRTQAQVRIGGDFMMRAYWENFWDTRDNRESCNTPGCWAGSTWTPTSESTERSAPTW